jgi:hypothetical protein
MNTAKYTSYFIAIIVVFVSMLAINTFDREAKDVGEVYEHSYTYCKVHSYGAKGMSWCSMYASATEKRVDRVTEGRFFNLYSYRVVK